MEQIPKNRLIGTFFICFLLLPFLLHAQSTPFSSFKKYPFPPGLCAGYLCNKIAWAVDKQGVRNIYIAEAPNF